MKNNAHIYIYIYIHTDIYECIYVYTYRVSITDIYSERTLGIHRRGLQAVAAEAAEAAAEAAQASPLLKGGGTVLPHDKCSNLK